MKTNNYWAMDHSEHRNTLASVTLALRAIEPIDAAFWQQNSTRRKKEKTIALARLNSMVLEIVK